MKRNLIIGKTNVGKTLFCIHFAQFMGVRELRWLVERTDGKTDEKRMSLAEAERTLSDTFAHCTRNLQSIHLEFPRGKGMRQIMLTDTTGLTDGIHSDVPVRESMAQTLQALVGASVVLHVVDAHAIGREIERQGVTGKKDAVQGTWTPLDEQISAYGATRDGYLVLANKMDLPGAKAGYRYLCKRLSKHKVIPVSALHGSGFREVRHHVWRLA